jgi:hypothetical protein
LGAYLIWGFLPLYLLLVKSVHAKIEAGPGIPLGRGCQPARQTEIGHCVT